MMTMTVPTALAEDSPLELLDSSFLTAVREDNIQYITGAAVGGEWTTGHFNRQFNSGGMTTYFWTLSSPQAAGAPLVTGTGAKRGDEQAIAVVKGDLLGTGTSGLSQLVTMARLISNPSAYAREQQLAADINDDGKVTLSDLVQLATGNLHGIPLLSQDDIQYPTKSMPGATMDITNVQTARFDIVIRNLDAAKVKVAVWPEKYPSRAPVWQQAEQNGDSTWRVTIDAATGPSFDGSRYGTMLCSVYADGEPVGSISKEYSGPAATFNSAGHDYSRWSGVGRSFLYQNSLGGLTRVECEHNVNNLNELVHFEEYDANFVLQSSRTLPLELPRWGSFFATESYNYIITGQSNPDEREDTEVVRLTQYDKNWNRTGAASLYGSNVFGPFECGNVQCVEKDGWIYVITGHGMYAAPDGVHHQARLLFAASESTLEVADHYSFGGPGYTSHSFNQFILADSAGNLVSLNHGDAYPRGLVIHKYTAADGRLQETDSNVILSFPGETGNNDTGCSVGGFVETGNSYLTAYNYDGGKCSSDEPRDIYVGFTDKISGETKHQQLTYGSDTTTPHVVPVTENTGYIMWNTTDHEKDRLSLSYVQYVGNTLGEIRTINKPQLVTDERPGLWEDYATEMALLSDCQPMLWNGKIIWYTSFESPAVFYVLDDNGVTAIPATGNRS